MNKRAEILHEHIIFLVLNVVFFSVMVLFIYLQASSVHLLEEETAKGIALLIDVAKPGTEEVSINLKDFFEKAEKNGVNRLNSIEINKEMNLVIVRGSKKSFFEYGYFNDGIEFVYSVKGDYFELKRVVEIKNKDIEEGVVENEI